MAVDPQRSSTVTVWPAAFLALVCAAPLMAVAALAVFGPWSDYLSHIASTRLVTYLVTTGLVTSLSALIAVIIGTALAWIISRYEFVGRSTLEWAVALPLAIPAYAAAYAWYDLIQAAGPLGPVFPTLRGPIGVGFILGITLYPYVYLLARQAFSGQSADAFEAARTLGAKPASAFWRVALPMARPAIAAGLALVVMESLADYGAAAHLGAPTLSVGLIIAWAGEGASADAARLAMMLVSIAFILFAFERQQRSRVRQNQASGKSKQSHRVAVSWIDGLLALLVCLLPLTLALIIPLIRLGILALNAPIAINLSQSIVNSIGVALISGIIAAGLGFSAAYALRSKRPMAVFSVRLAGLGYAVPGSVAALGVLVLLGVVQSSVDNTWTDLTGSVFPVLFTGTILALIFAYQSRFAAAAISPAESALSRVSETLDSASRTLGATASQTVWRIHWPLIRSGVFLAGLLVFVEVLKELPATMILRPFDFPTLAVTAHNYAADERLDEAALPATLIALIATPAMIWIAWQNTRQRDAT